MMTRQAKISHGNALAELLVYIDEIKMNLVQASGLCDAYFMNYNYTPLLPLNDNYRYLMARLFFTKKV